MLLLDGQVHHDTHVIPMGNYVIGVGNYVIVSPSELGNYVSADKHWVVASFEHHTSPHGLPRPHIHNIAIPSLTTGANVR